MDVDILLIALAVLVFALLAGRLGGTPPTMPMLCTDGACFSVITSWEVSTSGRTARP